MNTGTGLPAQLQNLGAGNAVGEVDEAAVVEAGVAALGARAAGDRPEMFNLAIV
jgi:hypothetical protein